MTYKFVLIITNGYKIISLCSDLSSNLCAAEVFFSYLKTKIK